MSPALLSDSEWERCSPWIEAALDHAGGTHSLADVRGMLASGEARMWAGKACALVATIEQTPQRTMLLLWLAGGDLDELVSIWRAEAEAWGSEKGCTTSLLIGRRGWVRALKSHGYTPHACVLMKEL
jgi:hypothetical protein